MSAPVLVLGWGNPARGDDALGPAFVQALQDRPGLPAFDALTDYQLQVEHALDLAGRDRVLFVDASRDAPAPFEVRLLRPGRDASFTSHALSPQAVLQVMRDIGAGEPPAATLLAIRGEQFELGEPLGASARAHLAQALEWGARWLAEPVRPTGAA